MLQWKAEKNILLLLARLSHFHFPGTISLVQVNMLISGEVQNLCQFAETNKLWRQIRRTINATREATKFWRHLRNSSAVDEWIGREDESSPKHLIPFRERRGGASLRDAWRMRCGVARAKNGKLHARAGRPRPMSHLHFVDDVSTLPRENTLDAGYISWHINLQLKATNKITVIAHLPHMRQNVKTTNPRGSVPSVWVVWAHACFVDGS